MLPKSIDLTDFSASKCSDMGLMSDSTMLRVFELNVKNPAFAQQKNSSCVGFSLKNYR